MKAFNVENCKKWTAALRSGEYQQCTLLLHDATGGHCCLGVAEILAEITPDDYSDGRYDTIKKWIGPGVDSDQMGTFMNMNDRQGKSFSEIADYIDSLVYVQELEI